MTAPAPKERLQGARGGEHLPASARQERMQGVRGRKHLPAPAPEEPMQGVRGRGPLPAPADQEQMQGVRGRGHLPAPAPKEPMQGVRGREHLPAPAHQEPMQGVRGWEHLPASAHQEPMQGVRGRGHLPAPAHQEPMQGVRGRGPLPAPASGANARSAGARWPLACIFCQRGYQCMVVPCGHTRRTSCTWRRLMEVGQCRRIPLWERTIAVFCAYVTPPSTAGPEWPPSTRHRHTQGVDGWGSIPVVFFPDPAGHPCPTPACKTPFPPNAAAYWKGVISVHPLCQGDKEISSGS